MLPRLNMLAASSGRWSRTHEHSRAQFRWPVILDLEVQALLKHDSIAKFVHKCVLASKYLLRRWLMYEVDAVHTSTSTCTIGCLRSFDRALVQVGKPTRTYRFC